MAIYQEWNVSEEELGGADLPVRSSIIRSLLHRRGVTCLDSLRLFTEPDISDLHDPSSIHGMEHACGRIARAIRDGEAILIYGDYDVDGVTSIVLLSTVLRSLGAKVDFVIPHRLIDGYGLKLEVIDRVLSQKDVKLVITVDCGITSVEPVSRALERGIDVIITDHHLPPEDLPAAAAVLNPHQDGCTYPFKELAGVGVAFKLCSELLRRHDRKMSLVSLMKIACLGTIADVAPLIGENRTISRIGLGALHETSNPGLRTLLRSLSLYGRPLRSSDVGFKIGPRLNAPGRLASADTAIELFAARDEGAAWPLVTEINRLNQQRQSIEASVRKSAEEQIPQTGELPPILVLAGEGWHRGVVGLTAGRIAQKYNRPVLVIATDGARGVGSGRSIPSVDLHGLLSKVRHLFEHFGGHEFACGFSLASSAVPLLRQALLGEMGDRTTESFRRAIAVDGEIQLAGVTREFLGEQELLQPFGAANNQPTFVARGISCPSLREFSEGCWNAELRDGSGSATGVLWPSASQLLSSLGSGGRYDMLVQLEPDRFTSSGVRLVILDVAEAG